MAFIQIPADKLVAVAIAMAAQGYSLETRKAGERKSIAEKCNELYPRTDGNLWKFPNKSDVRTHFLPALPASDSSVVKAEAGKARKASKAPEAGKAQGARNHKPDCNCKFCERIRGKAQAQPAQPVKAGKAGKAQPVKAQPVASGKLTQAQIDRLLSLAEANAATMAAILAS